MIRYLPGIVLAQIVAALLTWLNHDQLFEVTGLIQVLAPSLVVALVTTFWFNAIARRLNERNLSQIQEEHSRERENLKLKAERARAKVERKAHQSITREVKRTHAKANLKVGAALTGAIAFGVLMMFTQLASIGLILLTGAGGALAGYMARFRRKTAPISAEAIDALPAVNTPKPKRPQLHWRNKANKP